MLANKKPVYKRNGKYKIHEESYLYIPAGTLVQIYRNVDKNDPTSDVETIAVRISKGLSVISTEGDISAKEDSYEESV